MPELPDITAYVDALAARIVGQPLERIRLFSYFLVRSVIPPITDAEGRPVIGVRRMGKQIVIALDGELFLVIHLMISGRLHWRPRGAKSPGKIGLAAFDFPNGTLLLTEASTKKRAALSLVAGARPLTAFDRGGLEVLDATLEQFRAALLRENHTLKRALTDPRLFSGIGNAYSDEILHRARLSPMLLTSRLKDDQIDRLQAATVAILTDWTERLRSDEFPEQVTAFRPEFAVHGRFREPCPECGAPVQRIAYAENECNYCAVCQNEGRLLADRALSRLLKSDWPKTLDELEQRYASARQP
jgi:formamidopyrimidine-DNA glycosylase